MSSLPAAATVLYRPDVGQLAALLGPLEADGLPLFIHVNGPVAPAAERLLADLSKTTISRSAENLGLGHGLNAVVAAAEAAGHACILLFDQDSIPSAGLGIALQSRLEADAGMPVAAIGPLLVAPPGEAYLAPWYSRRKPGAGIPAGAVDFLPTSGTLVSIAAWRAIGPFREDYFVDGIDVEWCFRAWSRGYACLLAGDISMAHRWGHADDGGDRQPQILRQSDLRSFYYLRNATHGLTLRHVPLRWRLRVALRLALQSGLLLLSRRADRATRRLLGRALSDGAKGRLGPAPEEFSPR